MPLLILRLVLVFVLERRDGEALLVLARLVSGGERAPRPKLPLLSRTGTEFF